MINTTPKAGLLRFWPVIGAIVVLAYALGGLTRSINEAGYDLDAWASLPVQAGGREQPLDSVARNSLRMLSGRTEARVPVTDAAGQTHTAKLPAAQWLLDLTARPEVADTYPVFRVDHPEVLALFGRTQEDGKYFAFRDLEPAFAAIQQQMARVPEEAQQRTAFQRAIMNLHRALDTYYQLSQSFHPLGGLDALPLEYASWEASMGPGREAFAAREAGEPYDEAAFNRFAFLTDRYLGLSQSTRLGIVPPGQGDQSAQGAVWLNAGEALLRTLQTGQVPETMKAHARLTVAWRSGSAVAFNEALGQLHELTDGQAQRVVAWEWRFNRSEVFYRATTLYVLVMLGFAVALAIGSEPLRRFSGWALGALFVVHTLGILARMLLQGYPPVTNLYSSAIFVGWAAVGLGLLLEALHRNGVGGLATSLIGFATLIVAHNLYGTSHQGDTLEPMRAVLNSNFWLATHVVIITLGYSAVFVAGALGLVYLFLRFVRPQTPVATRRRINSMVYGITCFGLLFSFVGTMLGGVWADQSWGRFWGWDPKENGALIIVLWGALMLHARWGGLVKETGFMQLAVFGNIITAWSWFGTNMLGVGLHSYGFMDSAFFALSLFWLSQLAFIASGWLPPLKGTSDSAAQLPEHPAS